MDLESAHEGNILSAGFSIFLLSMVSISLFLRELIPTLGWIGDYSVLFIGITIGNLFGSNIFNIFILGIDDIIFIKGPLLAFVSIGHIVPALSASIMTAIAIIGLTYGAHKKPLF